MAEHGSIPSDINVGVLTGAASGGLVDIDLDGPFTVDAGAIILPFTGMVMGRDTRPASHRFYLVEGSTTTVRFPHPVTGKMLVEFRGDGCQTMMAGSIHPDDRHMVRFEAGKDGEPARIESATLLRLVGHIAAVSVLAELWIEGGRHNLALRFAGLCALNGIARKACETVVQTLCAVTSDNEVEDRLLAVETTYSRLAESLPVEWRADLTRLLGSGKAVGTLIEWMGGAQPKRTDMVSRQASVVADGSNAAEFMKLDTDVALAEWFNVVKGDHLLFADRENQFYKNVHGVYEPITATEAKGEVTDFLKGPYCNNAGEDPEKRRRLQSVAKINATYEISKSLFRVDDRLFDEDDHLLGTENGVFDLSKFEVVDTNAYVTKRIGSKFIPGSECPLFMKFVHQVLEDDEETISYLQRAIGYTLTGSVDAQVMFILTGKGANGKSVLLKLLSALMGTYGGAVPAHTITQQKFGNDKTDDLASLTGKRFVVASEGDAGDKLAVAKIKRMVAGDPIAVRKLYGSYFDLQPKFKLWFGSNDLPQVSGTDYAIWRRIHVIPFTRTFEPHERDPKLLEKLKVELPGIFNWALDGLKQIGAMKGDFLAPPGSVLKSVEEYRAENDNVSKFVSDRCVQDPGYCVSMGELYENYKGWCYQNAVEPVNNNMLGKDLTNLGFPVLRRNTGNARQGLKLK
ncbi:putative DNA primase/helicase [Methylobacterium sp. PvR107]|nr:putative DNA primase/helicase [Methylobacterium sp. PvR107]